MLDQQSLNKMEALAVLLEEAFVKAEALAADFGVSPSLLSSFVEWVDNWGELIPNDVAVLFENYKDNYNG